MEPLAESWGERGEFQQGFLWFDSPAQPQAAPAAAAGGSGAANGTLLFAPSHSQLLSPIQAVPPLSAPLVQPLAQPLAPLQPPPPLLGTPMAGLPLMPLPQPAPLQPVQAATQPMQLVPIDSLHGSAMPQLMAGQMLQQEIVVEQIAGQAVGQVQHPPKEEEEPEQAGSSGAGHGGGQGRGRGRGRGRVSEEERKARNRATQARFRERQKEKNQQMLAEHAATEAELHRRRQEQEGLQAENAVLQKMLVVREEVLMRLGKDTGANGGSAAGAGRALLEASSPSPATASAGAAQQQALQAWQQLPKLRELHPVESGGSASSSRGGSTGEAGATTSSGHGGLVGAAPSSSGSAGGAASAGSPRALQRRTSSSGSGGGMSRAVARQMEMLGHDISAHMAQLELPVTADPDEAMRLSFSLMQELPSHPLPAIQQHAAAQQQQQQLQLADAPASEQPQQQGEAEDLRGRALVRQPPGGGAGGGGAPRDGSGRPHGLSSLIQARPELVERVLAMTAEEFVAEWRELASNFKDVLAAHEERQSEEELERILNLFRDWGGTMTLTLHFRPENAEALFSTAGDAPPGMWEAACAQLEPTQAQRRMLAQLWHGYAAQAQAIRGERVAAVQAVQHAAQHAAAITPATLPASTLSGLMSRYLDMFTAAGRLSTLRDAEFVAMLQLLGRTGAVFSPVQKARLAAAAHPFFPDVVQIVRILASESKH
ncbi:hypothetical protein ABPG75_003699 [Micractinium tetrahymenae]